MNLDADLWSDGADALPRTNSRPPGAKLEFDAVRVHSADFVRASKARGQNGKGRDGQSRRGFLRNKPVPSLKPLFTLRDGERPFQEESLGRIFILSPLSPRGQNPAHRPARDPQVAGKSSSLALPTHRRFSTQS